MKEITPVFARTLSRLGQRGAFFGVALPEIAEQNPDVWVITADLATLSGLDRFRTLFPDRFLNVGIAEQNMIGIASGLAMDGAIVYATTYASFIAMRSFEQIRHNLGYQKVNVRAVGGSAGLVMGMSGNTHYTFEDIALMRVIPNMTVLSPADPVEAYKMAFATASFEGPVYIRLTGGLNSPNVTSIEEKLQIGRAVTLREGEDVGVLATGTMVSTALQAAEILATEGVSAEVMNIHTIKPFDSSAFFALCDKVKLLVTLEEHGILGGLGGLVAEEISARRNVPALLRIGLPDTFFKPASYDSLLHSCGLTPEQTAKRILSVCKSSGK